MIAGQMRIPWVPVDNARIARRHAHSIALAAYFRHRAERDGQTWRHAGPFFSPPTVENRTNTSVVLPTFSSSFALVNLLMSPVTVNVP